MNRVKASVTVVALITVLILMLLAAVVIILIMQSGQNTARDAERNRAKWYLEGRVEEYFDALISGGAELKTGRFLMRDKAVPDSGLSFEIGRTGSGYYALSAVLSWKNRYKLTEYVEFDSKNIFDYALFVNGGLSASIRDDTVIAGNMGANGPFSLSAASGKKLYIHSSADFTPRFDYYQTVPRLKPSYFSRDPLLLLETNSDAVLKESGGNLKYRNMPDRFLPPSFDSLWANFYRSKDDAWFISEGSYFAYTNIINRWNSEKRLIAVGDGYSTVFDYDQKEASIYIKKLSDNLRLQNIESRQYAYCSIKDASPDNFYLIKKNRLYLKASSAPVPVSLPDNAWDTFGQAALGVSDFSCISRDERLAALYLYKPSPMHELREGRDFKYDPEEKKIRMLTEEFYNDFTFKIGTGDGRNKTFRVNKILDRLYFYIGDKRTESFNLYPDRVEFLTPPAYGSEVRVMRSLPFFYIRKAAPAEGAGIFTDREEKAVVLDLSAVQNYPDSGVIMSVLPLVIKGEASQPLVVVSKDNIYIENMNPENRGQPVAVISKKGVWLLKNTARGKSGINKCIVYSPLKGLYTIDETGGVSDQRRLIYGALYLTLENEKGAMDLNSFDNNVIYFPGIGEYCRRKPFSLFPAFLEIKLVRRNF